MCTPVSAPLGMSLDPCPGFVHHETTSRSAAPTTISAQRVRNAERRCGRRTGLGGPDCESVSGEGGRGARRHTAEVVEGVDAEGLALGRRRIEGAAVVGSVDTSNTSQLTSSYELVAPSSSSSKPPTAQKRSTTQWVLTMKQGNEGLTRTAPAPSVCFLRESIPAYLNDSLSIAHLVREGPVRRDGDYEQTPSAPHPSSGSSEGYAPYPAEALVNRAATRRAATDFIVDRWGVGCREGEKGEWAEEG